MDDDKRLIDSSNNSNDNAKKTMGKATNEPQQFRAPLISSDMTSSDASVEAGLDVNGNQYSKLCSVVDKLQDHEWYVISIRL